MFYRATSIFENGWDVLNVFNCSIAIKTVSFLKNCFGPTQLFNCFHLGKGKKAMAPLRSSSLALYGVLTLHANTQFTE